MHLGFELVNCSFVLSLSCLVSSRATAASYSAARARGRDGSSFALYSLPCHSM